MNLFMSANESMGLSNIKRERERERERGEEKSNLRIRFYSR